MLSFQVDENSWNDHPSSNNHHKLVCFIDVLGYIGAVGGVLCVVDVFDGQRKYLERGVPGGQEFRVWFRSFVYPKAEQFITAEAMPRIVASVSQHEGDGWTKKSLLASWGQLARAHALITRRAINLRAFSRVAAVTAQPSPTISSNDVLSPPVLLPHFFPEILQTKSGLRYLQGWSLGLGNAGVRRAR